MLHDFRSVVVLDRECRTRDSIAHGWRQMLLLLLLLLLDVASTACYIRITSSVILLFEHHKPLSLHAMKRGTHRGFTLCFNIRRRLTLAICWAIPKKRHKAKRKTYFATIIVIYCISIVTFFALIFAHHHQRSSLELQLEPYWDFSLDIYIAYEWDE